MTGLEFRMVSLLLMLAVFLPAYSLLERDLSGDESTSMLLQSAGRSHVPLQMIEGEFRAKTIQDAFRDAAGPMEVSSALILMGSTHPPLYFIVLSAWKDITGGGVEVSRILSLLFHIATVFLIYFTFRAFDWRLAFLASAVYCTSVYAVLYAGFLRPYAFTALLISLQLYAASHLIRLGNTSRKNIFAAIGVSFIGALIILTNYVYSVTAVFVAAGAVILGHSRSRTLVWVTATVIAVGLLLAFPIYRAQHLSVMTTGGGSQKIFDSSMILLVVATPLRSVFGDTFFQYRELYNTIGNVFLYLLVLLPFSLGVISASKRILKNDSNNSKFLGLILFVIVFQSLAFVVASAIAGRPIDEARFSVPLLVMVAPVIGLGLYSLRQIHPKIFTAALVFYLSIILFRITDHSLAQDRFSDVADWVTLKSSPDSVVVLGSKFINGNSLGSFVSGLPSPTKIRVLLPGENVHALAESVRDHKHIFLIFHPIEPDNSRDAELKKVFRSSSVFSLQESQYHADLYGTALTE